MTATKSFLSVISALALATGAAFAGEASLGSEQFSEPSSEQMASSSLETTDAAYFAQSESMTDPMTLAESGQAPGSDETYYIVPMEVVEVEEIWLVPSPDSELSLG